MTQARHVLGGLTADQFLTEYWQKKPLLVRNALPDIIGMFEPQDIIELAQEQHVTARLLTQNGAQHQQWKVKHSPLKPQDFRRLPPYWTLLVQAIDHYSLELQALWQQFDFIPQWRRDDIMVSYAPQGGSVGQHFDFYDVFLVQGYGHRRWQLGQICDEHTPCVPKQPLRLLADIAVNFDEILAPGDLLYVPPRLAHYGVAQDDCLTFSFGFRMPSALDLIDSLSQQMTEGMPAKTPFDDFHRQIVQSSGLIIAQELQQLKQQFITHISQDDIFQAAVMMMSSEPKYPDNIPENEPLSLQELYEIAAQSALLQVDPASRLLYCEHGNDLQFWANGEVLPIDNHSSSLFKRLADGEILRLDRGLLVSDNIAADILKAINLAILLLHSED